MNTNITQVTYGKSSCILNHKDRYSLIEQSNTLIERSSNPWKICSSQNICDIFGKIDHLPASEMKSTFYLYKKNTFKPYLETPIA